MTNEPEATAYHEQQQSGDDEAQSERKDGTCGTKRDMGTIRRRRTATGHREAMSDLSQELDVLPLLELVWRRGQHDSERLERKSQERFDFDPFPLEFLKRIFTCLSLPGDWRSHGCWFESQT